MREEKFITIGQMVQRLQMLESGVEKAIRILRKNSGINRKGGCFGGESSNNQHQGLEVCDCHFQARDYVCHLAIGIFFAQAKHLVQLICYI